ncbi:hypothetical protein Lesp02_70760 [Lentzea sp. NBRC 105346]|uniref:hypothetical protein n=1 Tax=Lentzea sp. NBRC 105346 TaxID=3032205 RepID=UPI0024A2CAF2|nr:hypothetical protein [Lentzea sp. NBRC 105346]GLZ34889.1 hypothetical protein Lesp02_70760 [Lentzea sp. NBRC 105346]
MPEWITSLTVGQIAVVVGGAGLVLGLIVKAWKAVRPVWVGVRDFLDDWRGEPGRDGVPERHGVMKRLATIEADGAATRQRVKDIEHELHPNSGSSLRDQVDGIRKQLTEHIAQQQG